MCILESGVVPAVLPKEWRWTQRGGKAVGAGGKPVDCDGKLEIQGFRYVVCGQPTVLTVTVMRLPKQIQLLIGAFNIRETKEDEDPEVDGGHSLIIDYSAGRVCGLEFNEKIRLDWLTNILARQALGPVNWISFCGGLETQLAVAKEMGFIINICFSFE
jgi:hypothetical protein